MASYDDYVAWHVWTAGNGTRHQSWVTDATGMAGFAVASRKASNLTKRAAEQGEKVTNNFVQLLPRGSYPN